MPFLADIFFSAARNLNVTWYAEQTETLCLFASIWQKLGFTGKIMVDDSVVKRGLRRANVHFVPKATAWAEADVFVFDFRSAVRGSLSCKGLNGGPDPSKDLRVKFAHVVKYERERNIAGKRSRRIISLNAINNRFENVRQRVAIAYSPFYAGARFIGDAGLSLPTVKRVEAEAALSTQVSWCIVSAPEARSYRRLRSVTERPASLVRDGFSRGSTAPLIRGIPEDHRERPAAGC
jgi:hypothetical protein